MNLYQSSFESSAEAEAAFYAAFNRCDIEAMAQLWADDDPVCVHPGSSAIVGYAAVIRSWEHILTNAQLPDIQVNIINRTLSETLAVHLVEEKISTGEQRASVLATNVYKKYDSGWLMIEHHGSIIHAMAEAHTIQ